MKGDWKELEGRRRDTAWVPNGVKFKGDAHGGRKGFVDNIRQSTLSFFFTNFPDGASKAQLWKVFATVGDVADVFIPSKVDRRGRRFGFVRFREERDVSRLEQRLGGVWMGTYKIQVNRSHSTVNDDAVKVSKLPEVEVDAKGKKQAGAATPPVVISEVGKGLPRWGNIEGIKHKAPWGRLNGSTLKTFNMEFCASENRLKELNACYVGLLAESKSASAFEFQHALLMEGYHYIKATDMGGDSILLSSSVDGAIPDAIASNKSWWSTWLRAISVWNSNLVSTKRRVWLRILGVPLHIWEENFFNSLALKFGKCEEIDEATKNGSRYDIGRVRVLTGYSDPIEQIATVYVAGEAFPVTIMEERFGNVDCGLKVPPQHSVPSYSSGSDECSSGGRYGFGGSGEGLGSDVGDGDWLLSDGRCGEKGQITPSVNALTAEQKTSVAASLNGFGGGCGNIVQLLSQQSVVGVTGEEYVRDSIGTMMVMDEEPRREGVVERGKNSNLLQKDVVEDTVVEERLEIIRGGVNGNFGNVEVGHNVGSGLKILFEKNDGGLVDNQNIMCVGRGVEMGQLEIGSTSNVGQKKGLVPFMGHSSQIGPISPANRVQNVDSDLSDQDNVSDAYAEFPVDRELAGGGATSRYCRRKVGARRGGKTNRGRGGKTVALPGASSRRLLQLAVGRGKRGRNVQSSSEVMGPQLQEVRLYVELPNLNSIPEGDDAGNMDIRSHEDLDLGVGNSVVPQIIHASSASRLLSIGRSIGVTFRCGEDTMIDKLTQLEARDQMRKEERVMRNDRNQ